MRVPLLSTAQSESYLSLGVANPSTFYHYMPMTGKGSLDNQPYCPQAEGYWSCGPRTISVPGLYIAKPFDRLTLEPLRLAGQEAYPADALYKLSGERTGKISNGNLLPSVISPPFLGVTQAGDPLFLNWPRDGVESDYQQSLARAKELKAPLFALLVRTLLIF